MRRASKSTSILLALFAVPLFVAGLAAQENDEEWLENCEWNRSGKRERHCEVREATIPAAAALSIEPGNNGGVSVRGWDEKGIEVRTRIQVQAPTREIAREAARDIRIVAEGGVIRAEGPSIRSGAWSVSFVIMVPRSTGLTIRAQNGPVAVREVVSDIDVEVLNGPLSLVDIGGNVRVRSQNGPLTVRLGGTRWEGEGLDARTTNGPVDLAIPRDYSAQLETGTVNGPIDVTFPLTVTLQGRSGRHFNATLGSGGAPVRVATTNGPLSIRRR